jgi:ElaB/YqjD/DUF883 family membrane-anchored ribosome-binding protein
VNASTSKTAKEAEKAEADAKALADEISRLGKEFEALIDQVTKAGITGVEELTAQARARAAEGIEAGEALAAQLRGEVRHLNDQVVETTRQSPWRALGLAALIGVLVGLLIRR